jgi:disulfide bond formation protein DsbB
MSLTSIIDPLPPKAVPTLVLAACVAVLGTALASQYLGGLQPCILCLYQRVPYWAAIGLSLLALIFIGRAGGKRIAAALIGLAAIAFLIGAGIAAFHVGVEQHWWAGTAECGASGALSGSTADLRAQLLAQPVVRCDEVAWSLFGISMAGFNVPMSLGLALFAALGARRIIDA